MLQLPVQECKGSLVHTLRYSNRQHHTILHQNMRLLYGKGSGDAGKLTGHPDSAVGMSNKNLVPWSSLRDRAGC